MRANRLFILPALLVLSTMLPARADILDENLEHLVQRDQLVQKRAAAHEQCIRDVPASAKWLADPSISNFCLARYGSKRLDALFLGVRLSAQLDSQGKKEASLAVEALLVKLESPEVLPPLMTKR